MPSGVRAALSWECGSATPSGALNIVSPVFTSFAQNGTRPQRVATRCRPHDVARLHIRQFGESEHGLQVPGMAVVVYRPDLARQHPDGQAGLRIEQTVAIVGIRCQRRYYKWIIGRISNPRAAFAYLQNSAGSWRPPAGILPFSSGVRRRWRPRPPSVRAAILRIAAPR